MSRPPGGPAEADRADTVDGDDVHPAPPLPEPAGTPHQGARRPRPDEQHVQSREAVGDGRGRGAEVRPPVVVVAVLVEPDVPVVGRAQRPHVPDPGRQQATVRRRFAHHVHMAAQRLHLPDRRLVAALVGHAQEAVSAVRCDDAEREAQIPRGRLDENAAGPQQTVALGGVHHLGGRLQFDGPGEVEPFALEEERQAQCGPQVDVELLLVELCRIVNDWHGVPRPLVHDSPVPHVSALLSRAVAARRRIRPRRAGHRAGPARRGRTSLRPDRVPRARTARTPRSCRRAPRRVLWTRRRAFRR